MKHMYPIYKPCPAEKHAQIGQEIELGQCLGHALERGDRWGRLVGIIHNPDLEIHRYVIREYQENDGAFPTGKYVTTSIIGMQPHTGEIFVGYEDD